MSDTTHVPTEPPRYSMLIEWSSEDQAYIVSFPEWEATGSYFVNTHGDTYEEAVANGHELLADMIARAIEKGKPLPQPHEFATSV